MLKEGMRIRLNDWPHDMLVERLPKNMNNHKGVVHLKVLGDTPYNKIKCELGHISNGRVKFVEV